MLSSLMSHTGLMFNSINLFRMDEIGILIVFEYHLTKMLKNVFAWISIVIWLEFAIVLCWTRCTTSSYLCLRKMQLLSTKLSICVQYFLNNCIFNMITMFPKFLKVITLTKENVSILLMVVWHVKSLTHMNEK